MSSSVRLDEKRIQEKSGRVKALAWTGARRHPNFASAPTFQELGAVDFVCCAWFGLFAPATTHPEITRKLFALV
jgi:tripartite-type tricarboxylate transporter receptor subunit TctC